MDRVQGGAAMPPIEAALIKPVVDALLTLFKQGENLQLKHNAEKALREAIRELLLANPDENKAEARIAIAKAAGIISEDIVLAEHMLEQHRATKSRTSGRSGSSRKRKVSAGKCTGKRGDLGSAAAKLVDALDDCADGGRPGAPTDTD
jgi:hypothetical protein